jgi:phage terminase large subunit
MPQITIDLSGINDIVLPVFKPLLYDQNPVILMRGSRGSGKSYFWAQEIVYRILADLNTCKHNIIVLRKWSEHCDKSVVKQIKKVISDWGINELVSHNKVEKSFTFPRGSQIVCMGANDPERLKSITDVTSLVLEEATEFSGDDFATLDLSMRGDHGTYLQSILSFNPINISNWVYTKFYEHGQLPGVTYHHSTFRDNPYVGKNYSERIESLCGQNDYLRRVLMEGEWGAVKGLIYDPSQWTIARPERLEGESIYGLDFGWNHPTALVQATRINDDTFYLKELVYASELTNIELIGRMQTMDIGRKYIYADGARPEIIEEIFKARFNIHPADKKPGSVWSGITFCKRFKFILDPESTNLIDEFRSYSWKVNKQGVTLDEPIKEKDDACDAVRYGIFTHLNKKVYNYGLVA